MEVWLCPIKGYTNVPTSISQVLQAFQVSSFYNFLKQHNQLGTCGETFYIHMVTFGPNSLLAGSYWWTQIAINPTSKAASVWIPFTITKSLLRLKANSRMWAFVNVKEQVGYLQQTMVLYFKREERGDSREVVSKAILRPSRANLKLHSFTWSCWDPLLPISCFQHTWALMWPRSS